MGGLGEVPACDEKRSQSRQEPTMQREGKGGGTSLSVTLSPTVGCGDTGTLVR